MRIMTNIFDVFMKLDDAYRIFIFPDSRKIYMRTLGNEDFLYCGKDGLYVPFPDELGLYNINDDLHVSMKNKYYVSGLYTWNEYSLTWNGMRFLKIASQCRHVTYEVGKIDRKNDKLT